MEPPDFDDDDLIDDYANLEPEEDDPYDEFMEDSEPSGGLAQSKANADTKAGNDSVVETSVDKNAISVLDPATEDETQINAQRSMPNSVSSPTLALGTSVVGPFEFDRYTCHAAWRTLTVQTAAMPVKKYLGLVKRTASTQETLVSIIHRMEKKSKRIYLTPNKDRDEGSSTACFNSVRMTFQSTHRHYARKDKANEHLQKQQQQALSTSSGKGAVLATYRVPKNGFPPAVNRKPIRKEGRPSGAVRTTRSRSTENAGHGHLWVDKYAPSKFSELLSDHRTNRNLLRAVKEWDTYVFGKGRSSVKSTNRTNTESHMASNRQQDDIRPEQRERVILLSGPPGVGKTTLAHIVAKHAGYRPFEINASDERSASVLVEKVRRAMESSSLCFDHGSDLSGRPNCLILDEVDGADSRGAIQALVEIIRADIPKDSTKRKKQVYLRRPIIFICNRKYSPSLRALLPYAKHFNALPPATERIVSRLEMVLHEEKYHLPNSTLHQLANVNQGDIRSCLFTLQFSLMSDPDPKKASMAFTQGNKDREHDLFEILSRVFRKERQSSSSPVTSFDRLLETVGGLGDNSRLLDCLFYNMPQVSFVDPTLERLSHASDRLSEADTSRSINMLMNAQGGVHALRQMNLTAASGALHLLCRASLNEEVSISNAAHKEVTQRHEMNLAEVSRFLEGMPLMAGRKRRNSTLACEIIPFLVSVLSSSTSVKLGGPACSYESLSNMDKLMFEDKLRILHSYGLTYARVVIDKTADEHDHERGDSTIATVRLEPGVEDLVLNLEQISHPQLTSDTTKLLLARHLLHSRPDRFHSKVGGQLSSVGANFGEDIRRVQPIAKVMDTIPASVDFLGMGAKRNRETKSARKAAQIGIELSKKAKLAHTGSGLFLGQVIRMKYVKGFTQAVRTPCQSEDVL